MDQNHYQIDMILKVNKNQKKNHFFKSHNQQQQKGVNMQVQKSSLSDSGSLLKIH